MVNHILLQIEDLQVGWRFLLALLESWRLSPKAGDLASMLHNNNNNNN